MAPEFSLRENSDAVPSAEKTRSALFLCLQEFTSEFSGGLLPGNSDVEASRAAAEVR